MGAWVRNVVGLVKRYDNEYLKIDEFFALLNGGVDYIHLAIEVKIHVAFNF